MLGAIGRVLLAGRVMLAVFFLGLIWGVALLALRFLGKLWDLSWRFWTMPETELLIALLHLIDGALVASLAVIVALASHDSLVHRLQQEADRKEMRWVARVDHVNLKIKVATALVAISGIHLLQDFLQTDGTNGDLLGWRIGIHLTFLASALLLGLLDRIDRSEGEAARNEVI